MINNTQDLSKFGYRELDETAKLLAAYKENRDILGDGATVEFNRNSGNVFLLDEDYNVAMMNGDTLELWYNCPYCGHEGFMEDMKEHGEDDGLHPDCIEYLEDIGALDQVDEE